MKAIAMTIDDESSIYVGGLPYDATEDTVRRVFDPYGEVVAVKIINDRSTRGKCYGFVTFTNPRSAISAINDMNDRTFDGRVLKVNGVKTRGGRSNFSRESFQRYVERGTNWGRGRDQERDYDRDRDRYRDRNSDLSRERDRSRDHDQEREKVYDHARGRERARDHFLSKDRDQDQNMVDNEQEHGRNRGRDWERDHDLDWERGEQLDRTNGHDKSIDMDTDQQSKRQNGFVINDRRSREISSESCDAHNNQVKVELERSIQVLDELKKETSQMEETLEEKQKLVLDLQKKAKKLEDALIGSKKHTSYRQVQLNKLYKCFLKEKDYSERLKRCEEELQALVDAAMLETDDGDFGSRDGVLTTGNA